MLQDGPRRQGRFLKKSSAVYDKVLVQEFSFKEIGEGRLISHDNPKRTVIHTQYHSESDLKRAIVAADAFERDLVTADRRRPVMVVRDFTKDWERDHKQRKNRVMAVDDEDFDTDGEASDSKFGFEAGITPAAASPQPVAPTTKTPATAGAPAQSPAAIVEETPRYESMDVVGKAIKNLIHPEDDHEEVATRDPLAAASQPAEFIPVNATKTASAEETPKNAEAEAVDAYHQRLALVEQNKAHLITLEDEAKAVGYEAGFKIGEEKGEVQTRQNAAAMFGKINELIAEFANLRNAVLDNVQHNFYELSQAVSEALLNREFKISPDAFATVVRRAITEAVGPAKFKIRLNPELYDKVAAIGPKDIVDNLVKDKDIDVGDFKIESELSVVDVSVRKLIADLLDQADLDLFDKKDKAG